MSPNPPFLTQLQTGMRSYFNGGGTGTPSTSSATPPPSISSGGARRSSSYMPGGGRSSSASLPRSPDNDLHPMVAHSSGGQGSSNDVYVNIYQNTNHPSLFVSVYTPGNTVLGEGFSWQSQAASVWQIFNSYPLLGLSAFQILGLTILFKYNL